MYKLTDRQHREFMTFVKQYIVTNGIRISLMFAIVLALSTVGSVVLGCLEENGKAFLLIGVGSGVACAYYIFKFIYFLVMWRKVSCYGYVCCPGIVGYVDEDYVYHDGIRAHAKNTHFMFAEQKCMYVWIHTDYIPTIWYAIPC